MSEVYDWDEFDEETYDWDQNAPEVSWDRHYEAQDLVHSFDPVLRGDEDVPDLVTYREYVAGQVAFCHSVLADLDRLPVVA